MKIKIIQRLINLWKDPVISKVISAGIILLVSLVWNKIQSINENITFYESFFKFWNYSIKLWIILIAITFFTLVLIAKKSTQFKYDDDTLKLDRELYLKIKNTLLTDEMMIEVKYNTFSNSSFEGEKLLRIIYAREEVFKAYFEFLNPKLEKKKVKLMKSIDNLYSITSSNISGVHGTMGWLSIPREWTYQQMERFERASKNIAIAENEVSERYDDLIKSGKRILKV